MGTHVARLYGVDLASDSTLETEASLAVNLRDPIPLRMTVLLAVAAGMLLLLHLWAFLGDNLFGTTIQPWMYRWFWFSGEFGLPAWFSSMMLAAAALLLLVVTIVRRMLGWPIVATSVLAAGFFVMSADEMLQLHENTFHQVTRPLMAGAGEFARTWTVLGGAIALAVGLSMLPLLKRLPVQTRWLFLIAGAVYVGGAVGFEALSGLFDGPDDPTVAKPMYNLVMTLEETFEKAGVLVFLHALATYLAAILRHHARRATSRVG